MHIFWRLDTVDRLNLDETRIILYASELSNLLLDIEETYELALEQRCHETVTGFG